MTPNSKPLTPIKPLTLAALIFASLALVACGHDTPMQASGDSHLPARIVLIDGDGQLGHVDSVLPRTWIVQVTDSSKRGVANVPIDWRITSGSGTLVSARTGVPFAVTDESGFATVSFLPTAPGFLTVSASLSTVRGALVTFTGSAWRTPDVVIRLVAKGIECGDGSTTFEGPDGKSTVTVRVGATVELDFGPQGYSGYDCQALILFTTLPAGAAPVDMVIPFGVRNQFVPQVPGTYVFVDNNNWTGNPGPRGTLIVQP
ncbi:MAG: hypothetical protein ABI625_11120 [bacterium]